MWLETLRRRNPAGWDGDTCVPLTAFLCYHPHEPLAPEWPVRPLYQHEPRNSPQRRATHERDFSYKCWDFLT